VGLTPASAQGRSIVWRRVDRPGHEFGRLFREDRRWHLAGTAVLVHERQPCRLDYVVVCDARWETVSARVTGWMGDAPVEIDLAVDGARGWRLNGTPCPAVAGCLDVDLGFSPSTNLLPIRRLDLAIGEEAEVRAAWLGFPSLTLSVLEQRYRRLDVGLYRYESDGGRFVRDLEVDVVGLVTRYPGFWEMEQPGG
jgi:hypothetical protein